jgi:ADP-ribose pyrophosphatase
MNVSAMTDEDAELLDRSTLYKGFFEMALYTVRHRLFAGGTSPTFTREILERPPVAAVLLYDPGRDSVVQIEQFRVGKMASGRPNPWMLEIVPGHGTDR